jgi:ADP-ribosyl-[dinitrogen reductase] hydrolase
MVGAAVGDALGAPFEFGSAGEYRRRFPTPVLGGSGEMIGGGAFGWAPGEFTDDTQMALALAETWRALGQFDPDAVWSAWRTWARTAADVGATTRRALAHPDWRDVPDNGALNAGNGALMRSFPLAVAMVDHEADQRRRVVLAQASLTHADPAAGWGAWLAVEIMAEAIGGADLWDALERALAQLPDDQRRVFAPMLDAGWTPTSARQVGNGSVWGCLAEAVWAVRSTTSFADALVAAIDLGGDTDTVACVAGALAGARDGIQTIPSRWTAYLHGRVDTPEGPHHYRLGELISLTNDLLGTREPDDGPLERPAGPTEVAPGLYAANLTGARTAPTDLAVLSLCSTDDAFIGHPIRRQVYLIDDDAPHNPDLGTAVVDALDGLDALLADGHGVVVHCHGGRSRTGLVLKAWKMRRDGLDERAAHHWLAQRWPHYDDYNSSFVAFLTDPPWAR